MTITADILVTPPQPAATFVAPPRPAVASTAERENAQHERRESSSKNQSGLNFRAALSAATLGEIGRAPTFSEKTTSSEKEQASARPAKVPDRAPVEISGAEAADLFTRAVAENTRKSLAPAFVAATARYSSSYFAGSAFQARPGDTLELTA